TRSGVAGFGGMLLAAVARSCRCRSRKPEPAVAGVDGALSLPALPSSCGSESPLHRAFGAVSGASLGLHAVDLSGMEDGRTRPLDRLDRHAAPPQPSIHCQ